MTRALVVSRPAARPGARPATRPAARPGARPGALALVLGLLLALAGGTLAARPAAAHDALVGSDPAAGAVLDAAPTQLVLTFSGDLLDLSQEVRVTAPDGTDLPGLAPVVAGPQLTVPLPEELGAGAYTVLWRVVSGDGHPIEGTFDFSLSDAAAPAPTTAAPTPSSSADATDPTTAATGGPTTGPTGEPTSETTSEPTSETTTGPSPDATPTAAGEDGSDDGLGAGIWIGAGTAVLAGIVAAAWIALRRPRDDG
ncbi:copper resistance CopC family protein [Cellulomonas marina]|uniref:CopC domain-containing protein n=1 Tax=Cellulomonas marina TaxID=988821 RepID=A0A1I0Y000_9CELL|nr:copper resistance CopC family protein [Cellulomonas marina]GIG28425.1 hypothetical protein Cma02nite_10250 [Cellulomonas marina]SFB06595.1 hypothetical protein SAMN05421867_10694 [Cellulomonas marina]